MLVKSRLHDDLEWLESMKLSRLAPAYSTPLGVAYCRDSLAALRQLPSDSVNLVMTSPPFALTRKKEYGNEPMESYLDWFTPFCLEIQRILKDNGSFVLDIGGAWRPGAPVRSMYHFELAVELGKIFELAQEFYWYNPAKLPTPAEWVTVRRVRVKDAVNMVWWFSKTAWPKADNRSVLQPYSESMKNLLEKGYTPKKRPSGHDISPKFQTDNGGSIPPNLISIANTDSNSTYFRECKKRGIKPHPARYPESLVEFFVDFLTDPNDIVLDPFAGSNVTGFVCENRHRRWLSFELESSYIEGSMIRFETGPLFDRSESSNETVHTGSPKSDGKSRPKSIRKRTSKK